MPSYPLMVRHLRKTFLRGSVAALQDVDMSVPAGELVALLGPSGCGKTTILRCIGGLETPDNGEVWIGDKPVFDMKRQINLPPERHHLGMVFQSYAVWPHMTVFNNVSYPLRVKRVPGAEVRERTEHALQLVGLDEQMKRYPAQLSGGQQQRVALARAIVAEPAVLLFDEPLSNLDASLRERMREEIRKLQQRLRITSVYVTHDQSEAMAIADRIIVLNSGVIEQQGTPYDLYESPATEFVANFIGLTNLIPGCVDSVGDQVVVVQTAAGRLVSERRERDVSPGESVNVSVRPNDITLAASRPGQGQNVWTGTVRDVHYMGDHFDIHVQVGDVSLRVRNSGDFVLKAGDECFAKIDKGVLVPTRTQ